MQARTFTDDDYENGEDVIFDIGAEEDDDDGEPNCTRLATIEVLSRQKIMSLDEFTHSRKKLEKRIDQRNEKMLYLLETGQGASKKIVGVAFSRATPTSEHFSDFHIASGDVPDIVDAAKTLWEKIESTLAPAVTSVKVDLPRALHEAPRFGEFLALGFALLANTQGRKGRPFEWVRGRGRDERNMAVPEAAPQSVVVRMKGRAKAAAPAPAPAAQEPAKRARPTHPADLAKLRKTLAKYEKSLATLASPADDAEIAIMRDLIAGSKQRIAEAERNVRPVAPYTGPSDAERETAAAASARAVAAGATMFDAPPELEAANPLYDAAASAAEPKHAPAAGKKRTIALMNACVACGGAAKMREPSSETHRGLAFCDVACQRRHRAAAAAQF
jgi:hypothetical protein